MAFMLKQDPSTKLQQTMKYAKRYASKTDSKQDNTLEHWGMEIDTQPVAIETRQMKGEAIWMLDRQSRPNNFGCKPGQANWTPDWNFKIKVLHLVPSNGFTFYSFPFHYL